ncbi:flagellar motor switch protein FliN [Candidatus Sulfurimonas baltica]|uniref:Flagellar motor switch protein FliN n=1 Tax=Candidatus Sulfurimonas baltica TaxID=2740404 RepID=A0A7S7RP19_9BACT|nr:flagellar motor switch protein FliN [Candidatus Sulfurimonas baltica]
MSKNKNQNPYGEKPAAYNPQKELSWMNYGGLLDMEVEFVSILGETELTVRDVLKLAKGSLIDLKKPAGESVESYVNGRILGKGEVMVYEKNLAIRINEILDSSAVLYHLSKEKL